jgi:type I restriction enzyme R subunit
MEMIRDHIAVNLGIEIDAVQDVLVSRETGMSGATDFYYAPFAQEGGLGKVHQLFGEEFNVIIEELNEALAA